MRRSTMLVVFLLIASQAFAARDRISGTSWIQRAPLTASAEWTAAAEATLAETGIRPIALIETNYYTFLPTEALQVRITIDPNGYTAPATLYLYWENRTTSERRYYNIAARALLPAGQQSDLFGAVGTPVPIVVPKLSDFVLFGNASDTTNSFGLNGAIAGSIITPSGQTGLFQYVLELRDEAGKRVISRSNAMYSYIESTVNVTGTITASTTWQAKNRYLLNDFVGVQAPAVLTIEPGTVVYGGGTRATLFIQRGAKIIADGTARRPIIMTSAQRVGARAQRDWGSLVLLGNAPINAAGGQQFLEGLPSQSAYSYGGADPADSSGIVRYVRLEFGGFEIEANQEINGLTCGGVGAGTVIDYVEVIHNKDDAFEFFGGTANARHLLGIAFADDGLDFDNGYIGNIQYAVLIKRAVNDENDGNNFTESDDHPTAFTSTPLTNPRVYNVTAIREVGPAGNYGGVLRRGTAGKFYNAIVTETRQAPITIRDDASFNNIGTNELIVDNSILFGDFSDARFANSADRATQTRTFLFTTMKNNRNVNPLLTIGTTTLARTLMPDVTPLAGSPALDADFVAQPPDNGFFERVDFLGGVAPGSNWVLSGWATFSDN